MVRRALIAFSICVLVTATGVAPAMAETAGSSAGKMSTRATTLAPGKAAGVRKAEGTQGSNSILLVVGAGVIIGGIALAIAGGDGHHSTSSSTASTR
jgi:hypothetical protein